MKKHPQNNQGITVHQRDRALKCTILVHFFRTSLWQFIFFHVALFHTAPYACCTFVYVVMFSCCTFFRVTLLLLVALFHIALSHVTMFSCCILRMLHSSHVANFSCCTLFILYYFQKCLQEPTNIYDGEVFNNNYQSL